VLSLEIQGVALYGAGARKTVKGGTGSGKVNERYSVTIEQGLLNAGLTVPNTLWLDRFDVILEANKAEWRSMVEKMIKGYGPVRTKKMFDIIHSYPMPSSRATSLID
jgi:hypothetical protein